MNFYEELVKKEYERIFGKNKLKKFCRLYLHETSAYFDYEPCYIVKCENCGKHFTEINTKKYCEDKIKRFRNIECGM